MRLIRTLTIAALALNSVCAYAASSLSNEVYIYRGGALSQAGITVGSWGSGKASESQEKTLTGNYSVKLTSQSLYSGGRIDFSNPVEIYSGDPDQDRYLLFTFFFEDKPRLIDPTAGTGNEIDADPYYMPTVNKLRFVFVDDKGIMTSIMEPTTQVDQDDNWVRIAVPLRKLKHLQDSALEKLLEDVATDKTVKNSETYKLSRLIVFSDIAATFHLGEIKLVTDNSPIKAEINGTGMVGSNIKNYFLGVAEGGLAPLKYSWDFNAEDGIQEECTGMVGSHIYVSGRDIPADPSILSKDFVITLTVSDVDGIKKPAVATFKVTVNN